MPTRNIACNVSSITHSCISSIIDSGITSNTHSTSPKSYQTTIHMYFIKHPFWHYIKHPLCITKIPSNTNLSNTHSYAFHQTQTHQTPIMALHQTLTLHHQNPIKHKPTKHPFICISSNTHQTQTYQTPIHAFHQTPIKHKLIKHPFKQWVWIKESKENNKIETN